MSLSLRRRGRIWYAAGVIRWGRQKVTVPEFSTGCVSRRDAEDAARAEEHRIVGELREGPEAAARRAPILEALAGYRDRPEGHAAGDLWRIEQLGEFIGDRAIGEAAAAWEAFCRMRCAGLAPATTDRFRVTLRAALNRFCDARGIRTPKIAPLVYTNEIQRHLTRAEERRLLRSYSRPARDVARFLCSTGCRTQEALRLTWRHVDLAGGGQVHFPMAQTKTRKGRSVPLTAAMKVMLGRIRRVRFGAALPAPDAHVFLSARRAPYRDTRGEGGNPLAKAHATACRRAGIEAFRLHDWRHHAASWAVMNGMSVPTLMQLFGWQSPRMVQRYVALSAAHVAAERRRVG
jgi:integrase